MDSEHVNLEKRAAELALELHEKNKKVNPKVSAFLAKHPSITMFGFSWSVMWRGTVLIYSVIFGAAFLIGIIIEIFDL